MKLPTHISVRLSDRDAAVLADILRAANRGRLTVPVNRILGQVTAARNRHALAVGLAEARSSD